MLLSRIRRTAARSGRAEQLALQILAFALVSAGALSVQNASRWYMRASIAADVTMAFKLILGPAVIPPCLLRIVLQYAALVPLLLTGCMLLMGVKDQMHKIDRSTCRMVSLVVWSTGCILTLLIAPGWLNDYLAPLAAKAANTLLPIGYVALIVEMFRAQRIYLQTEEQ